MASAPGITACGHRWNTCRDRSARSRSRTRRAVTSLRAHAARPRMPTRTGASITGRMSVHVPGSNLLGMLRGPWRGALRRSRRRVAFRQRLRPRAQSTDPGAIIPDDSDRLQTPVRVKRSPRVGNGPKSLSEMAGRARAGKDKRRADSADGHHIAGG